MESAAHGDAQPQIVIFAHRKPLVESACRSNNSRVIITADGLTKQRSRLRKKTSPDGFRCSSLRVYPDAVANPDLLGLADLHVGMADHEGGLARQLAGQPEIVGIEKARDNDRSTG